MKVRFLATMRKITGIREMECPVEPGEPLGVLLDHLFDIHPALRPHVLDSTGRLSDSTAVLVNGRHVRHLDGLDTTLNEDDTVTLLVPLGGG